MTNNMRVESKEYYIHQTEHFLSGFILVSTGQLYALAKSCELDKGPSTLFKIQLFI